MNVYPDVLKFSNLRRKTCSSKWNLLRPDRNLKQLGCDLSPLLFNSFIDDAKLPQTALSNVHWNKYESHFKFIELLLGNINLKPGPTSQKEMICYGNLFLSTTFVFLLSREIITMILYPRLAMTHGTYLKKETYTWFI